MRGAKYLFLIAALNIAFQLISDATAAKLIIVYGYAVSISILYFPVTYIISDVITEVYGYARARHILWVTILCSVIAGLLYQLVVFIPGAPFQGVDAAYTTVFSVVPRVLVGGWIAVILGDITNNYVMAKLKIRHQGKHLWFRTISSTICGQGVNTVAFYTIALGGVLPTNVLITSIIAGWVLKTAVEVILTPVTYLVINKLKSSENIDVYDDDTNFNPFIFKSEKNIS